MQLPTASHIPSPIYFLSVTVAVTVTVTVAVAMTVVMAVIMVVVMSTAMAMAVTVVVLVVAVAIILPILIVVIVILIILVLPIGNVRVVVVLLRQLDLLSHGKAVLVDPLGDLDALLTNGVERRLLGRLRDGLHTLQRGEPVLLPLGLKQVRHHVLRIDPVLGIAGRTTRNLVRPQHVQRLDERVFEPVLPLEGVLLVGALSLQLLEKLGNGAVDLPGDDVAGLDGSVGGRLGLCRGARVCQFHSFFSRCRGWG